MKNKYLANENTVQQTLPNNIKQIAVTLILSIFFLFTSTSAKTDTCSLCLFVEPDSLPIEINKNYNILNTTKTNRAIYVDKSNILKMQIGKFESIYKYYFQQSDSISLNNRIPNYVKIEIEKGRQLKLFVDSIYNCPPVFKSNNDNFKVIQCHVEGIFRKANSLTWKDSCVGGIINVPNEGEITLFCLGEGYYVFKKRITPVEY